ncbi:hypothetical protein HDU67_010116 [Dinochytrium kinnereticum]|nr:hypothetical protein HDU67_010116 [Dinochytrium kinnereticum]
MPASPAPSIPSTHAPGSMASLDMATPVSTSQSQLAQNQPRQPATISTASSSISTPSSFQSSVSQPSGYDREPRTSLTHPIGVSWMFPDEFLALRNGHEEAVGGDAVSVSQQQLSAPVDEGSPSPATKPVKDPIDWLDRLGIEKLPMGRAPSASGYVGGFRVAASYLDKSIQQQQQQQQRMKAGPGDAETGEPAAGPLVNGKPKLVKTMYKSAPLPITPHGNFALSSCPGKKVRMDTGPVNGRAMINRDLNLDFGRLAALKIKLVVCCLNNAEMSYLGAPWPKYSEAAQKHGMDIVRLPIIEGSCPESMESLESVLAEIESRIGNGIGRAGLVACCFLIRRGYVVSAERAIQFIRVRRSPKAIETQVQEDFIAQYFHWVISRRASGEAVGPSL